MKLLLLAIVVFFFLNTQSLNTTLRREAYVAPGLFFEKLSNAFPVSSFSFYSSKLYRRLTTSTVELFSFTFGAFYSLNKKLDA